MRKSWNGRLYGAIIWCDPLAVFVERGKTSKMLTSAHFSFFFFFHFYSFYCLYLEFMQDLPRNWFRETDSQSGTFGKHLENNYCDNFRSSAKKLSSIIQWLALSSDVLKVQNLKFCSQQETDLYQLLPKSLSEA